jgi:PIN domain nuclease of toxin-antitoxin system
MNKALLLDTHVWFRYQTTPHMIRPSALRSIDDAAQRSDVFVSVISVWELAMLERDGMLFLQNGVRAWVNEALNRPGIHLVDYSPAIAIESVQLPHPMHKDPSDRILVATARVERLTLVTADKAILAFAKFTALDHLRA